MKANNERLKGVEGGEVKASPWAMVNGNPWPYKTTISEEIKQNEQLREDLGKVAEDVKQAIEESGVKEKAKEVVEAVVDTVDYSLGVGDALLDNLFLGKKGRYPCGSLLFDKGQDAGDKLSLLLAGFEMRYASHIGSAAGGAAGAWLTLETVGFGTPAAIPLSTEVGVSVTLATFLHGSTMFAIASKNIANSGGREGGTGESAEQAQGEQLNNSSQSEKNSKSGEEPSKQSIEKMNLDDIGEFLGEGKNWHKTSAKSDFLKKFRKELNGDKNADFYIDKNTGEVYLKSNKSGIWIKTDQTMD